MNRRKTFTIRELADEFDITPRTIRFYEDKGLLHPTREGQKRVYTARDRTLLKLILRGKRLGFTLDEAKTLFELYDPSTNSKAQLKLYLAMIQEKQARLKQQLDDIRSMQLELEDAEVRCQEALKKH